MTSSPIFYAHSGNGREKNDRWETVEEHLRLVSQRCAEYAAAFDCCEQARYMGLLHDLGKYSAQFQRRLTVKGEPSRDHWTLGAVAAITPHSTLGLLPAVAILGHHVGLETLDSSKELKNRWSGRITSDPHFFSTTAEENRQAHAQLRADGLTLPTLTSGLQKRGDWTGDMLDARMLFSTLVDADFVETEAHFAGDNQTPRRYRSEGIELDIDKAITAFERYCAPFTQSKPIGFNRLRQQLSDACSDTGSQANQGLFTLSAPTGAGKTLAMLSFALQHAKRHRLRRIVLVMPFLNIIDQTAKIYRQIFPAADFGDDFILESHSLADREPDAGTGDKQGPPDAANWKQIRRRLLSQNWDAPIVLTTNVQLLESMFANQTSACRKLHRLAQSVILFDEVQTLPSNLAVATLAALRRLASPEAPYRCSVVFATATQPAFDDLSSRLDQLLDTNQRDTLACGWQPQEIVTDADDLFAQAASRVRVSWQEETPRTFTSLASELSKHSQVLCIVNLKRHAIDLAMALKDVTDFDSVVHLSTNMCTEHRLQVLATVRERLAANQPLRLIATQCVEAGVDLDFPVVYRALAPLESIAQAAGRCNRSAKRTSGGDVIVFTLDDPDEQGNQRRGYPPGYHHAICTTSRFLQALRLQDEGIPEVINDPAKLREYYRNLYAMEGRTDKVTRDEKLLIDALKSGNFIEVAEQYRLISANTINVLVPYDRQRYDELVAAATEHASLTPQQIRVWIKQARPHAVSLFRPQDQEDERFTQLLPITFGKDDENTDHGLAEWWYPAKDEDSYDPLIGLQLAETSWIM